ncbi:FAD-dependent oxidoreductase [archaeon]|jgi:uncharacterized protein|nr:FAD-dependent oxidoreductase [archaeon]
MEYDVVIVGSGPAGLFAADRLAKEDYNVLVIDERRSAGGSGTLTDGKLVYHPKVTMDLDELKISEKRARMFMDYIDDKFLEYGADPSVGNGDKASLDKIIERSSEYNVDFIVGKQRHMGTDNTPKIIRKFKEDLESKGIEFKLGTKVDSISKDGNIYVKTDAETIECKYLIMGPGRSGAYWMRDQAEKLDIKHKWGAIDVGVRVELAASTFDPITDVSYDAKFHYNTLCHGDKVRTFCVNPHGFVTAEPKQNAIEYRDRSLRPVNGHSFKRKKSDNTNFAILSTITMTEPYADTTELGRNMVVSAYRAGGWKPLVQRWGDLKRGSRSKIETFLDPHRGFDRVIPTMSLDKITPGDLNLAYYGRFVDNIKEFIEVLDNIVPGTAHPSTLLYAPEVKFYDTKYATIGSTLETNVENIFVTGDGAGKSRGIVGAGLTGILAAESIINKK